MASGSHSESNNDGSGESDVYLPTSSTTDECTKSEQDNLGIFSKEVRLVLVGRTGSGKSATGNSILGGDVFRSICKMKSVTSETQHGTRQWRNRDLVVIDTPGIFDTDKPYESIKTELIKCVGMAAPGPHAFLYIIKIGGRHTKEEAKSIQEFVELFGVHVKNFLLIVFTAKDRLEDDDFQEYLQDAPEDLNEILENIGRGNCFALNNKIKNESNEDATNRADTVEAILSKIAEMIERPLPYSIYTNEMLQNAQSILLRRIMECVTLSYIRHNLQKGGETYTSLALELLPSIEALPDSAQEDQRSNIRKNFQTRGEHSKSLTRQHVSSSEAHTDADKDHETQTNNWGFCTVL